MTSLSANQELTDKTVEAETKLGRQVTFAHTPAEAAVRRKKSILFYGVLEGKRYYAFASEHDREQFVFDANDTLFTVNRDLRVKLDLSPPMFVGTVINGAVAPPVAKKRNKFRK